MRNSYDLTQLDSHAFEHMVNFLSLKVLGNGITGFAAGSDGGRDGYLVGKAPYPSPGESWEGVWCIQSKFHKPHLSKNSQAWLIQQVKSEIEAFEKSDKRKIPDNWIIATNIEPSGTPQTGAFDILNDLVKKKFGRKIHFDIWGGRKILDFLAQNEDAVKYFSHFITPGHILHLLYENLKGKDKKIKDLIEYLIISQFNELIHTKLEQAGSGSDQRPKIYELFEDLPVSFDGMKESSFIMNSLVSSSCNVHKTSAWEEFGEGWRYWSKIPSRAKTILLKGGPGQGKSTAGQYFSQIQKAAFILSDKGPKVTQQIKSLALDLKKYAEKSGYWPTVPRVPIFIELKDYANWYSFKSDNESRSIIAYLCEKISLKTNKKTTAEMFEDALQTCSWFVNFDGLDEVPNDLKDKVANEIIIFTNELCPCLDTDILILCTTRPQGYSGQFEDLDSAVVLLEPLPPAIALSCASSVVKFNRDLDEGLHSVEILQSAMQSEQVCELMTTPLQSHIMAVVVRDGGRPPERRWELFNNFYNVMKKRESLKNFPDKRISQLLRENDVLLKSIHDRLGISLHAKAESSNGAEACLDKIEFKKLAEKTTGFLIEGEISDVVDTLMEATTERLVFVNTPESSDTVRFDIRQLQEFFAAEFIYTSVDSEELYKRLEIIGSDSHWREIVHFVLSALTHKERVAELAVTIDILVNIDSHQNHKIKTFKRRLATGALLALRLLSEGVLEQDRRVRQQFVKVFQPLWGVLDNIIIRRINAISQNQSRNWLISIMIDSIMELDYSENISSGYLLILMMQDEHPRFNETKDKIINSPRFYLKAMMCMVFAEDYYRLEKEILRPQSWFIKEMIKIILSPESNDIETCNCAMKVIIKELSLSKECLSSEGVFSENELLLNYLLSLEEGSRNYTRPSKNKTSYSFVDVVQHDNTWITNTIPESMPIPSSRDTKGSILLECIKSIIRFSQDRSMTSLRNSILLLESVGFDTNQIPTEIKALIPIDFEDVNILGISSMLKNINDNDFSNVIENRLVGNKTLTPPFHGAHINNKAYNKTSWARLCKDLPGLAMQIWYANINRINSELSYSSVEILTPIAKIFDEHPEVVGEYFLMWGLIFKTFPKRESIMRDKLMKISFPLDGLRGRYPREVSPFIINLDVENDFLILLSHSLHSIAALNSDRSINMIHSERITYNETTLEKFGLNNEILLNIIIDSKNSDLLRIAALSCYLAQDFKSKGPIITYFFESNLDSIFCSLLKKGDDNNLISAIFVFFADVKEMTDEMMSFIGDVTYICREDFKIRYVLQSLYSKWRERSSAPVQKNDMLGKWLNYSYSLH